MRTYSPSRLRALLIGLVIMILCELFFVLDVVQDTLGINVPFLFWFNHTIMEAFATLILGTAIFMTVNSILSLLRHQKYIEESVQVASGHLHDVIKEYFKQWQLTPSEAEVAMLLFKGLSIQEIADLRATKLGTVKNQASSVYQKAGVKNRSELFSLFVEELLNEGSKSSRPE